MCGMIEMVLVEERSICTKLRSASKAKNTFGLKSHLGDQRLAIGGVCRRSGAPELDGSFPIADESEVN